MSIRFNMNTQKAIESIIWITRNGESNMYNIWKILFAAEKYHLNKYGRPITGDKYIAMEFGTVPSWLYDATKIKRPGMGFIKDANSLIAARDPMSDYLSQSDLEALSHGVSEYAGLSFSSVKDKNHEEPAWKKNYNLREDNDSGPNTL
ncbi:MAG: Panacea domain-containing protein [Chitinispirillia bacterium]|nr:Panacea domain-containing protein [Chitinispirillia bacterium]